MGDLGTSSFGAIYMSTKLMSITKAYNEHSVTVMHALMNLSYEPF